MKELQIAEESKSVLDKLFRLLESEKFIFFMMALVGFIIFIEAP